MLQDIFLGVSFQKSKYKDNSCIWQKYLDIANNTVVCNPLTEILRVMVEGFRRELHALQ